MTSGTPHHKRPNPVELRLSTEATDLDPDEGLALDDGLDPQWAALAKVRAVVGSDPDRAFWSDRRGVTGLLRSLLPGGTAGPVGSPEPDEPAATGDGYPPRPREGARPLFDTADTWPSSATSPSDGAEAAAAGSPPVLDLLDAPPAGGRRFSILGSKTTARRVQQGSIVAAGLAMLALTAVLVVPDEGRVEATDSTTSTAPVPADTPATATPTTADPLLLRNTLEQDSSSSSSR